MPRLLIVHHTPSPHTQEMFEAVVAGATDPEIEGVEVVRRPALTVSPVEMLEADGYLLGTPANLGYISGALKHFFDTVYYTQPRPRRRPTVRALGARQQLHRRRRGGGGKVGHGAGANQGCGRARDRRRG
jgi:multimeric flavodoxin WrbA